MCSGSLSTLMAMQNIFNTTVTDTTQLTRLSHFRWRGSSASFAMKPIVCRRCSRISRNSLNVTPPDWSTSTAIMASWVAAPVGESPRSMKKLCSSLKFTLPLPSASARLKLVAHGLEVLLAVEGHEK